jgi:hypothetical protein
VTDKDTFTVEFKPNPVQHGFITSQKEADLFSSRRGEGKSTALCWSCYNHTRHNPGANWAFVRDTFENLQKTTMKTFFEWFPQGIFGTYHHTRKEYTWANGVAEGTVSFVGMDDPADATRFLSWELAGIAFDEPAPAFGNAGIDESVFDLGMTCLRQQGMKWYAVKLAENNPDETHWTYKRFVQPGEPNFALWQPQAPENLHNLPEDYYEKMRRHLKHRPDLIRRFIDGEFGFQQAGKAVTPQWNSKLHLTMGLSPIKRRETILLWDFGLTPVCIITQITPSGHWLFLDSVVGEGVGVSELIEEQVKPLLAMRYEKCPLRHIGDPAGKQREQTSASRSAVKHIRAQLGGTWRPGPIAFHERRDAIQWVLSRSMGGCGLIQVDAQRARHVHYALRGGWHYHVARSGIISEQPRKTHPDSDVGDAVGYGAAILFPPGRLMQPVGGGVNDRQASYFNRGWAAQTPPPAHGSQFGAVGKGYFRG